MEDERPVIVFLVLIAAIAWIFTISSFVQSYKTVIQHEELATIYDTPSDELREIEAQCQECGQIASGINGEIVCRNRNCSLYGIATKVDK